MAVIPLSGARREKLGKGGARKARTAGRIPGVLYGHGEAPVPVSVQAREFDLALRGHKGGNPIVNLAVNGAEYTALIRDVQYDPLSHDILHLDFQHISLTETIEVKVAVHLTGLPVGVKDGGGILETILREISVRCLPTVIPPSIEGVPVDVALSSLLWKDRNREIRQVHGVDGERAFCHTGAECVSWCGHDEGPDFTVAGNMLAGPDVIAAMARTFSKSDGELASRLLLALEAGQAAGGDKRGKQSAALLVASPEPRMYHNLRVDDHVDPVGELRRIYELVVEHSRQVEREYGPTAARLFGRVKH